MKSARNLGGTLYWRNYPVVKFKFNGGMLIEAEQLTDDKGLLPFEITEHGLWDCLVMLITARPTPDGRIGIHEKLKETPIQYYNVERMLRYCHAQSVHDCYWIKQDNDISCWIGSPLEGIGIKPNERYEDLETAQRWK